MEAFRVICETCRSRLKVRSASVIGEIHACPKCGSMVQIAAPVGWSNENNHVASVAAISVAAEPMLSVSSTLSNISPDDFAFVEPVSGPVDTAATSIATSTPIAATSSGFSPIVWFAIGGATVLSAIGAGYALRPTTPIETSAQAAIAAETKPEATPTATIVESVAINSPKVVAHSNDRAVQLEVSQQEEAVQTAIAAATESTAANSTPPDTSKSAETPKPEAPAGVAEAKPPVAPANIPRPIERPDAVTPANAKPSGQVLKFDPLDFDPDRLSLSSGPANSTNSVPAEATSAKEAESDKVPSPTDLLPPPVTLQPINVERGPVDKFATQPAAVDQRLAVRIHSLQLTDVTLARFVDTLSELAGAAITLDPVTLELNGLSPRTAVSTSAADATLEKILAEALGAQRLEWIEQDGGAIVALANRDERKAVDFDVSDLATGTDAVAIARLVEKFVAPTSWKSAGGKGTIEVQGTKLHIDQSLTVRREALIFCERLRLARHLSLRSKYPAELLSVESPFQQLAAKLSQSTTFTFLPGTRLADVAQRWQESLGLTVLVDWAALRDTDIGPTSTLMCSANNRPWAESLDGVLHPLGLGWWAVDAKTIQVTSLDALEQIERVEFYAVPKQLSEADLTPAALVAHMQKRIAAHFAKESARPMARIDLDERAGQFIIRATPAVHRFLSDGFSDSAQPLAKRD